MSATLLSLALVLAPGDKRGDEARIPGSDLARRNAAIFADCFVRVLISAGTPRGLVDAVLGPGIETGWSCEGALLPGCFQRDMMYCNGCLSIAYTRDERGEERVRWARFFLYRR